MKFQKNYIFFLLSIYAIAAAITIYVCNGTGDSGDSIYHYLFAKLAPKHPSLFFDHWAKPLYVFLFSPFAQFGFIGVKIFNVSISITIIFFTYKIIQKLNIPNPLIGALIVICSPLYYVLTFSGLTEYLFALFICIGLYSLLINKVSIACITISFLPFIRSEGLIIIGVFALYLISKKLWKFLPYLTLGHLFYSIAGYFVYKDLLWVLNKIPYARLDSTYGSGRLFHFVEQFLYVVGVPIYILFWIGVVCIIWQTIHKKTKRVILIIVLMGFFTFFIAHSLFWYLGIFNSMGLKRVLIGVAPFTAIISLIGFNCITEYFFSHQKKWKYILQGLIIAYILIFPFTSNPSAINAERDLMRSKDQYIALEIATFIQKNNFQNSKFIYAHPYISEALQIDHFDTNKRIDLAPDFMNKIKSGDMIIWENWFAVVEYGIKKEYLDNIPELSNVLNLKGVDRGREIHFAIYIRK